MPEAIKHGFLNNFCKKYLSVFSENNCDFFPDLTIIFSIKLVLL